MFAPRAHLRRVGGWSAISTFPNRDWAQRPVAAHDGKSEFTRRRSQINRERDDFEDREDGG